MMGWRLDTTLTVKGRTLNRKVDTTVYHTLPITNKVTPTGSPGLGSHILVSRAFRVPKEVFGKRSMGCSESEEWQARRGKICRWMTWRLADPPSNRDLTTMSGVLSVWGGGGGVR